MTSDREKVIRGLRCCIGDGGVCRSCPADCPYRDADETASLCDAQLMRDALLLLEEDLRTEDDGK